ncbi:MAG: hypothetical protein WCH34_17505 [Bacteroidota bacterium]
MLLVLFTANTGKAQINQTGSRITPNGVFDTILDRFGNKYKLSDLMVSKAIDSSQYNTHKSFLLGTCGYFNLYFEQGCGMEGNSLDEIARRNVLCELFSDLSNFIVSPLSNNNTRVNIWVRDITLIPNFNSSMLGLATAYYCLPSWAPNVSGIADNEVWKTINSGIDSYTNVYPPIIGNGGTFFHGMVAFNFTGINWHTELNTVTATNYYDFYSVALHEVTHALGFASLIDENGLSKFGSNFNYYTRYDLRLQTQASESLITNTGDCSLYDWGFNTQLDAQDILAPNPSVTCTPNIVLDNTECADAILYVGSVTQPVFTPYCFMAASSLSHFEDQCHSPTNYGNNEYYAMSNANGTGPVYMKRYLKPEERSVLCDIGYTVNGIYGSNPSDLNYYDYEVSQCTGINVIGIDDGITPSNQYAYVLNTNDNLIINDILDNDYTIGNVHPTSFECLEVIIGGGNAVTTSGTTFTYFSGANPGIALLRYVPVYNGQRGNITYVLIKIRAANCNNEPCSASNMINNGGFENGSICGQYPDDNPATDCWEPYSYSPEIQNTNCTLPTWAIPSIWSTPPSGTWDNGLNNNSFINLLCVHGGPNAGFESMQNQLSSPLIPNGNYHLGFYAKIANSSSMNNLATTIEFAASQNVLFGNWDVGLNALPAPLIHLTDAVVPNDNEWHFISLDFQCNSTENLNNFVVLNASYLNPTNYPSNYQIMAYIDDITLVPENQAITFNIPTNTLCINQTIDDLNLYTNPNPPGGTFSGDGVTCGNTCSFDATTVGVGAHIITYTYLDVNSCPHTESFTLNVINSSIVIETSTTGTDCGCIGTATATVILGEPDYTYTWSDPSNQTGITATDLCAGTYIVSVTDADNCIASQSATIVNTAVTFDYPSGHTVTGTEPPWSSGLTITVNGNIVVPNGTVFNVNNGTTVEFAANSGIIIESGGVMNINDGSILKGLSACDNMWNGVDIYGNDDLIVPGKLVATDATIQDTHNGVISEYGDEYFNYSEGGVVQANNVIFLNNRIGILMTGQSLFHSIDASASFINHCSFNCTGPLIDATTYNGEGTLNFIQLKEIRNLKIKSNDFNAYTSFPLTGRGTGIYSINSSYNVAPSNHFNNLTFGISAEGTGSHISVTNNNTFDSNQWGIHSTGGYLDEISHNSFTNIPNATPV